MTYYKPRCDSAGDIISRKRNRLGGESAALLLLVKSWVGLPEYGAWEAEKDRSGEENGPSRVE